MKKDNTNKYNNKRAKILLKGVIPSLVGIFVPKNKKRVIFTSTRNEFYNFNSKYLFEYFIKNHPEYICKYVINNDLKREELNKKFGPKKNYFIETESVRGMFYALRAKTWVTSAFETPVGGVFLNLNRFVYLLGHGTHFKAIVFNENNLSLIKKVYYHLMRINFTHYLVTSSALSETYQKAYKCKREKLLISGEPRHDKIYMPDLSIIQKNFGESIFSEYNVLYAPTWRPDGELLLFPFEDMEWGGFVKYLEENKINIYLRMHPSFQEDLGLYTVKTDRIKILDNHVAEDISDVMGFFDLLITDYSSIHISFLLLDKPVMFLPYDFEKYDQQMGFIDDYDRLTPGPKPDTMEMFQKELYLLLRDDGYYKEKREEASSFFNDYHYDNSKMNAEFIIRQLGE